MHAPEPIHLTELQHQLAVAQAAHERVTIQCFKQNGEIILLQNWLVLGQHFRGGTHRFINPANGQIRCITDIFILEYNSHKIYL